MEIKFKGTTNQIEVGNLAYGTVIMGVASHPDCTYVKVNKRHAGVGVDEITIKRNHTLLLNLKTGGLRTIPGGTLVTVLDASLIVELAKNPCSHLKDAYKTAQYQP